MTTRVLIANEGYQPVKVEIKGRDAAGRFEAVGEIFVTRGTFVAAHVHEGQSLQIFEVAEKPLEAQDE